MGREDLIARLRASEHLPRIPPKMLEIFSMLAEPTELELDAVVREISKVEPLNKMVMGVVHSGYFAFARKVDSLRDAVAYLGSRTIRNLLIALITRAFFPNGRGRSKVFNREKYWRHCIGTSMAGDILASKTEFGDRYRLFPYGLLHDIGIALLDVCLPHMIDRIHLLIRERGIPLWEAEREVLEVSHAEIGAWLGREWGLPEDFRRVIRYHHTPEAAPSSENEIRLVYLGDRISTEYYERLLGLRSELRWDESVMTGMGLTRADVEETRRELYSKIEDDHLLLGLALIDV